MKFEMTDSEIIRSFQNAEKPKDQVRILAELNGVALLDMAEKLKELGQPVDMRWYAQVPKKKTEKPEKEEREFVNVNEEMQSLKDEVLRLNEENRVLNELLVTANAKAAQTEKYRKIVMILMEETA